MPPTRGHDLKPRPEAPASRAKPDAPHTGARLETYGQALLYRGAKMPPTRGHDLKPQAWQCQSHAAADAPHTGARLETMAFCGTFAGRGDAPHTGARLETQLLYPA